MRLNRSDLIVDVLRVISDPEVKNVSVEAPWIRYSLPSPLVKRVHDINLEQNFEVV